MGKLNDKVIFITGGGAGMGKATAILAAQEGAKVVIYGRNAAKQEEVVKIIQENGGQVKMLLGDVSNEEQVKEAIDKTVEAFGSIDILVNNAGVIAGVVLTHEHTTESWKKVIECDLNGCFYTAKYAIPYMLKKGNGNIINISSAAGLRPMQTESAYTSAKAAVIQLTKTMAWEYADKGIRVNCICPGLIMTDMLRFQPEEYLDAIAAGVPMKRIGQPEEIAKPIVFLATEDASYINGAVISVDGGLVI